MLLRSNARLVEVEELKQISRNNLPISISSFLSIAETMISNWLKKKMSSKLEKQKQQNSEFTTL